MITAAIVLFVVALSCHIVFGAFTEKRGIFFGGIKSEAEYQKIVRLYHGRIPEKVVPLSQKHLIGLNREGSAEVIAHIAYACNGEEAQLKNMWNFGELRVRSRSGKELEFTTDGDNPITITVSLPRPNQPIQQFVLESAEKSDAPPWLRANGNRWEYTFQHMYGPPIRYEQVLSLPSGARLVSCEPSPRRTKRTGNGIQLVFARELSEGEAFRCHVVYDVAE
jgi:hypothetical protein